MGMFDRIYNSYRFEHRGLNHTLQTKDISGYMNDYWLTPSGQLFLLDLSGTYDFDETWKVIKNGNNGHVTPVDLNKTIKVLPESDTCYYEGILTFKQGLLVDAELWTGRKMVDGPMLQRTQKIYRLND